jgi:hypothetical protein
MPPLWVNTAQAGQQRAVCLAVLQSSPAPAFGGRASQARHRCSYAACLIPSMDFEKKGVALEAASRLVKLLQLAELQASDSAWADAAAALVTHIHAQADGCVSRKWQLIAAEALVIPALIGILSRRTAAPSLKLHAVDALRLTLSTNDANQKAASSAVSVLLDLITNAPPPPPPSEGPKAAVLARNTAEQLRDAALEALSELLFMNKPAQDAAAAAGVIKLLIMFINCSASHNLNPASTQARALRALANLARGNVIPDAV